MEVIARPAPIGKNERGNIDLYGGESLMVYRLLSGVTQAAITGYLRVNQPGIVRMESGRVDVHGRTALAYLDAVDQVVRNRARLVAEGEARRDGTWMPPPNRASRGRWRTMAEADAILVAQGRRGETSQ